MFFLFLEFSLNQQFQLNYTSSFHVNSVLSYGFKKNGKFHIELSSKFLGNAVILLTRDPFLKSAYNSYCENKNAALDHYNYSLKKTNETLSISGTIDEDGVYKLFLVDCGQRQSTFLINCTFSNPNTLLDYRNILIAPLFKYAALIYACIFSYWLSKAPLLQLFRYPLHTTFMILPLLRAFGLHLWAIRWKMLETEEFTPGYLYVACHLFDVVYFTTFLSSMLFLCAGCKLHGQGRA